MFSNEVRSAAVAGMFYPGEPRQLATQVDGFLSNISTTSATCPKALVVPHAGYIYSGAVAASAYGLLSDFRDVIERVVLLGPSHQVPLHGMAVPGSGSFETPLGRIPLDVEGVRRVSGLKAVAVRDDAHLREHSLEVQLPFLQRCLGEFTLLPVVVGVCDPGDVAALIESEWGDARTLLVISTDLSHYLPYASARTEDQATARKILSLRSDLRGDQACGCYPLNGMLLAAHRRDMKIETRDLRNSGDTAGPQDRVVGYGAFALYEA
jgi:AmmeMemoRadiSam system protein B